LVSEAQEGIQEAQNDAIRDCAIDAAVIKVEHFEMGSYRGLIPGAQQMGQTEAVNLLNENLRQEEETARIAERNAGELIQKAMHSEGQEEGLIDKAKNKWGAGRPPEGAEHEGSAPQFFSARL
jgi:ferritin-like metal-binding protein YciE